MHPRCIREASELGDSGRPAVHPSQQVHVALGEDRRDHHTGGRARGGAAAAESSWGASSSAGASAASQVRDSPARAATARLHASGHAPLQADSAVARAPRVTRPSPSRLEASLRHADQHHLCVRTGMAGLSPGVSRGSAGQGSGIVMAGPGSLLWRGFHPQPRNLRVPQARPPKLGAPKSGSAGCLPKSEHQQTHFENAL